MMETELIICLLKIYEWCMCKQCRLENVNECDVIFCQQEMSWMRSSLGAIVIVWITMTVFIINSQAIDVIPPSLQAPNKKIDRLTESEHRKLIIPRLGSVKQT